MLDSNEIVKIIGEPHVRVVLGTDHWNAMERLEKIEVAARKIADKDGVDLNFDGKRNAFSRVALHAGVSEDERSDDQIDQIISGFVNSDHDLARRAPIIARAMLQGSYEALVSVVSEVEPAGNWLYIFADLARPLDAQDLLIDKVPDLIDFHPQTSVFDVPQDAARELANTFQEITDKVRQQYDAQVGLIPVKPFVKGLKWLWQNLEKLAISANWIATVVEEATKKYKEEAERQAEQDRINRGISEARPLAGAENHVDSFDRNRDFLHGLA